MDGKRLSEHINRCSFSIGNERERLLGVSAGNKMETKIVLLVESSRSASGVKLVLSHCIV